MSALVEMVNALNETDAVREAVARAAWLVERCLHVGGSEVAALLGLDPWKSELGVWASKVNPTLDDEDSDAMELGREVEPAVARMFSRRHPEYRVHDRGRYAIIRHPDAPLGVTLDRDLYVANDTGAFPDLSEGVLEIKHSAKYSEWLDGVPLRVNVQVQAQLACTGRSHGWVAAVVSGRYREHRIERDDAFIEKMLERVREFWQLVETKTEPDVSKPFDLSVVKMLHPLDSGVTVEADASHEAFVSAWQAAKDRRDLAAKDYDLAESALRQAIGDATWLALPDGRKVACKVEPRKAELCKSCSAEVRKATEPRVLRLSKGGAR